jgi:dihydropteroate synthase
MGIVSRTPDSFFGDGRTFDLDAAVHAALAAAAARRNWADIGGTVLRPPDVGLHGDRPRTPSGRGVAAASDVVVSVDTFRPEVAQRGLEVGAAVINDTTGLQDAELADVVAGSDATLVITHSLAPPRKHYPHPRYDDVVIEVKRLLLDRVQLAVDRGVPESRIVIDPGHDLNKTTEHSLELTRRLSEIADIGLPLLAAVSNKDFVGEATGLGKADRLAPSIAAATVCALGGARILRMHEVAAAVAATRMVESILGFREPAYLWHNMN